jgi:uncharacterized protein YkwD
MGCICAGESDIEHFLTDFIDELKIRKYNDKTGKNTSSIFQYLEKNSPYQTLRSNYDEFLRSNQHEDMHTKYQNLLFGRSHHHFYASLIFLINADPKNMATNYNLMIKKIKTSHEEFQKESLSDLNKDSYDILRDVLTFYVRMVSLDIIDAAQKCKENLITEEQLTLLKKDYGQIVIDIFVKELMKDCKADVDIEEFFKKNHSNLRHPIVREKLRRISENKDSLMKKNDLVSSKKPKNVEKLGQEKKNISANNYRTENQYEYTLPIIENTEVRETTKNDYATNNYGINQVEDDEECVQGGAPGNYGGEMDNLRMLEEIERNKIRQQYDIYRQECLIHHNKIRASHGVPPLRESESLSEYSQQWANFISETDTLTHSSMIWDGKNIGENIAKAGAVINDPSQLIVAKWYEEKDNYDYTNPSTQNNTKNFTQMVWKNTESVGFGLSYSKSGNTFIVINYYPAGNTTDGYRENVTEKRF